MALTHTFPVIGHFVAFGLQTNVKLSDLCQYELSIVQLLTDQNCPSHQSPQNTVTRVGDSEVNYYEFYPLGF